MALPLDNPILCPILVGREPQLQALQHLVEQAREGSGSCVLLSGEAGVGKSRLLGELKTRADNRGLTTVQGNAFEQDQALPYGPVRDLFSKLLADTRAESILRRLAEGAPELTAALPELADRFGNAPRSGPEDGDKRKIHQAILDGVTGIATAGPLLLVIEDLHWSDDESLEVLLLLARRTPRLPLVLVLSYRSDEQQQSLRHFLAALDRERLSVEMRLSRLGVTEVDTMLQAIFGLSRSVRAETLNVICSLTDGNPFFIEEVLRSLVTSGQISLRPGDPELRISSDWRVPRSVQEAVQYRSGQLPENVRKVLSAAAASGRRFNFDLLQSITGEQESELLQALKRLIDVQLLVEEAPDLYAFRHALTRHAVYSQLLARERRGLHLKIVSTIERADEASVEAQLSDLAYHSFEAGEWARAAEYSQRAAQAAQRVYASQAALEQFSRAIRAFAELGIPAPIDVYRGRAGAYETLGEFDSARADQQQALDLARTSGDRRAEWQALLDLGALWAEGDYARTGEHLQQALQIVRELDDPHARASSLNRLGNWHVNNEEPIEGRRYHQEALAIFRDAGDARGTAETLDCLGLAGLLGNETVEGGPYYEEAVQLYESLGDRMGVSSTLATKANCCMTELSDTAVAGSTLATSLKDANRSLEIAREIGWRAGESFALTERAAPLAGSGLYVESLADLAAGLRIAEEIGHQQWMVCAHVVFGAVYRELLALPQAQIHLERGLHLARELKSMHWINTATGLLASTYVRQGRITRAEETLTAPPGPETLVQTRAQRLIQVARAELALARNRPSAALEIADRLVEIAKSSTVFRPQMLRARALTLLKQPSEAEMALRSARQAATEGGAAYALWESDLAFGRFLETEGRRNEAQPFFSAGRATVERLARQMPEDLVETFTRSALVGVPLAQAQAARSLAREALGGLTPRERDVTVRLVQGETNREIAAALVLSERTVESHIANILAKRGLASRREIARWAIDSGLVFSDPGQAVPPYEPQA
jgi:DNA-binding CsgD family transcriptional regulator